jgi:hypothetical protein
MRRLKAPAPIARRFLLAVCATMLVASPALADVEKQACIDAHASGQDLRKKGHLLEAADALATCLKPTCPRVLQSECGGWLTELEAATPSVVFDAVDDTGNSVIEVAVHVDGKRVISRLDGRAVPIDPGDREIVFEAEGGRRVEQRVLVLEGQKNRMVRAVFGPANDDARSSRKTSSPPRHVAEGKTSPGWPVYALGAASVIGLAGFATFGVLGRTQESELDECRGACSDRAYDVMRDRYLVADISLGVAVVSLSAAAVLWFVGSRPR